MSKVYFAGSIRGGDFPDRVETYRLIVEEIGKNDDLTSVHEAAFPPLAKLRPLTDKQIYYRDIRWIQDSQLMVAEITAPSLGVGYVHSIAELGKVELIA